MKKIFAVLFFALALAGCTLRENYAVQYGFSNEIITETKFEVSGGVLTLEVPFADFTCNQKSIKATLSRKNEILTMRLKGTETAERCSARFFSNISGLEQGNYVFRLIYDKGGNQSEQVLSRDFSIQ